MKNKSILDEEAEESDINISPMIDMVFILLIFFIVTTVFVQEPGVEIDKPPAVMAKDLEKNSILIAITNTNQIVYGGRDIGIGGVRSTVHLLTRENAMPVILQVDEAASSGLAVRAIDEAKFGGASIVSISTEL